MPAWEIPIRELMSLQERMNRLFDESLYRGPVGEDVKDSAWSPAVDIYELESEVVIDVEVPGIDRDSVAVDVEDYRLRIRGERRLPAGVPRDRFHRLERAYGPFSRAFDLPRSVDTEGIRAEYRNGVLSVRLPKRNENRAKHVTVPIE